MSTDTTTTGRELTDAEGMAGLRRLALGQQWQGEHVNGQPFALWALKRIEQLEGEIREIAHARLDEIEAAILKRKRR